MPEAIKRVSHLDSEEHGRGLDRGDRLIEPGRMSQVEEERPDLWLRARLTNQPAIIHSPRVLLSILWTTTRGTPFIFLCNIIRLPLDTGWSNLALRSIARLIAMHEAAGRYENSGMPYLKVGFAILQRAGKFCVGDHWGWFLSFACSFNFFPSFSSLSVPFFVKHTLD